MESLVVDAFVAVAHDRSVDVSQDVSQDDQDQRIGHLPQGPLHPCGVEQAERDVQRLTEASVGVVVDSQSVKAADTVPKASRGWDNTKKRLPEGHEAMVLWAMISLITQHLATQGPSPREQART